MSVRQDLIAVLNGHTSRRNEVNGIIYEGLNIWNVRDNELSEVRTILSGLEFSELFYNVESDTFLVWDKDLNGFIDLKTNEEYLMTSFFDDFESGSFATKGWVTVDGGENDWEIGTAAKESGTFGAYISNDGGTNNQYSSVGGAVDRSHLYVDILLPNALNKIILEFDWRCEAEVGFDYGRVFNELTSYNPAPNVAVPIGSIIGQNEYNNQSVFTSERIELPIGQAGTTRRLIWSWRNDSTVENQPPMAIDNVKILFS